MKNLIATLLVLMPAMSQAVAAPSILAQIQAAMRAGQYDKAAALAGQAVATKDAAAAEACFLRATAFFQGKKFAESLAAANQVLADFPKSAWRNKAVFLKAQVLIEQKKFAEAAAIYEAESSRILAPDRKQSLVGEILRFAEKLEAKPDPNIPDAPQPDFAKAYSLYTKAMAMELPRTFRDDIIFRRARAIQQAGNPAQAIQDLQAYLTEYDPAWTGPAGSGTERLPLQNPPPAGKHVALARFRLAEAFHQSGNATSARMELEDLLKTIGSPVEEWSPMAAELTTAEGKKLPAEIRWLKVLTYFTQQAIVLHNGNSPVSNVFAQGVSQIGNTGGLPNSNLPCFTLTHGELDQAIKTCREYLSANPDGSRATRAAWMIAEALQAAGRADDAIAAYRDFIAGKDFRMSAGEAANTIDEEIRATPATHLSNLKMRALFRIGQILATQKKQEEAIACWQSYIKDYPNGPEWSECQNAIIHAEFQMGLDALTGKQETIAMQRFEAFLNSHPLDARAPRILYLFGAIHEAKAMDMEDAKGPKDDISATYRKAIDEWAKLVSKYPESDEARAAMLKSGTIFEEKLGQFDKALNLYQKLEAERHAGAEAIARLTRKSLDLSTERVFRTNETPVVHLKLRNIEKCDVRLYKIDLQAYFRKMHGITGVAGLDVSLIQPDKSWSLKTEDYAKYKPLERDVEIPFADKEAGAYVVTIGDDDLESTVLVMRSDLEVVVKSSRREVFAFVQDMLTGKPAADVELLVSNGKSVAATGKTGDDGVFKTSIESLKDLSDVRVFALRARHAAAFNLPLAGLGLSTGLTAKGYLYTDRPAYLPGETVAMRGILRDVRKGEYAIPEDARFTIRFADPQGRLLSEQTVKLGTFGTFDASLVLPDKAAVGSYSMSASQERKGKEALVFQGNFEVREFKLEKIQLTMDFPRRVWFRGEKIEATLHSAYYWGEPLAKRVLRCTLPDHRIERLTTDASGNAKIAFDTTGMTPGSQLVFSASLDGDNVTATESLTLAQLGFSIDAKPSQPVVIAGEPFNLDLTTTAADGKITGETLKVSVLRSEKSKKPRILTLLPWPQPDSPPSAEVKDSEFDAKTDAVTGKTTLALKLEKGGIYQIRVSGTDRFGQTITRETAVEVSDNDDANKLRLFSSEATLKVGQDAKVRLHSRMDKGLALLTYEGETILRYQIVTLHKDYNDITFKTGHDLFPNFRLAAAAIDGRELRSTFKEFTVERELKVALKPLHDTFLPGEEAKIAITVTDSIGQPVAAELSLALVNEALFAVYADKTTTIHDFFQKDARRHAEFHTGATCAFRDTGTTRAVAKELTDEKGRLARNGKEKKALEAIREEMGSRLAGSSDGRDDPFASAAPAATSKLLAARGRKLAEADAFADQEAAVDSPSTGIRAKGLLVRERAGELVPSRREVRGEGRWLPNILTGADGKAVASIKMPETTTAWRLTARGCSVETLVGQATTTTLTRKDFFVELKTPSFLREGDEARVIGRIHNLTDFSGNVPLTLRVLDAKDRSKVLATREKSVEVKSMGGAEVAFDAFTIPNNLNLVFDLTGTAGDQKDSLEIMVAVQPWGLPYAAHAGGTSTADTAAVLQLPEGRAYTSTSMTVSIGPDVKSSLLDMAMDNHGPCGDFARIMPPPWGNHPGNDLLAAAAALAYAKSGNPDNPYARTLTERARSLVASLVASQAANGSWTGEVIGTTTTARVFWALITARNAGITVHKPSIDKAAAFLLKKLESFDANDNDSKAIALHALSCDKRADFAACNRLYRDRNTLGAATLAYLTRAFFNIERKEIAAELATLLEGKAKIDGGRPPVWESGYKSACLNDAPETTALVLLALAESKADSPRAAAAAQSLLEARGCFGYPSARAKGPAMAALTTWFALGKEQTTDMEINMQVNGKNVGSVKSIAKQGLSWIDVPADALANGKNVVEFKMRGRGRFTYAATLSGFSADTTSTGDTVHPCINEWQYLHAPLEYRGKPIQVSSSSPVKNLENGQRTRVQVHDHHSVWHGAHWFVLDIPLPAGARLVEESINFRSKLHCEVLSSSLRVFFTNRCPSVNYELAGYVPGKFRILPPVIREIGNPAFLAVGPTSELTVLAAGENSPDPYEMNIGEQFALGQCHFNDGDAPKALEYLSAVFKKNSKYQESELARMLLWIYTKPGFYDARKIVEMFEILRERFPTLEIPFDKILVCGKAYQDIGEHERAWLVYRAVISASFSNDSAISAVLEDEGRFLGSIDFQERVWRDYPDTADVVSSYFALSQLLYQKAPKAHELPKENNLQPEKSAMLKRTVEMLMSFLALYPNDPLADDAGFSLCNGMLDLKDYPRVVGLSREFAKRHVTSELAPGFQYMTALGLFWQKQHSEALAAARVVADGDSKDRDFARYILAQIYHAEGKPAEAIDWYGKVKGLYPDAAEAIAYFEKKSISIEEVTTVKPGTPVALTLKYRNIKEAFIQVYRVDLMKLYLQQKNLSAITSVQLAGIQAESEQTLTLGDGKDFVEKERSIPLALKNEAAYLVICRGDDLFTSGMVLITPLKIEVQEEAVSGRVRANVLDTAKGGYRPDVHVKAIGSADSEFRAGETDQRGLFIADRLRGKATVIAREGDSRYAFFRGSAWLGTPENAPAETPSNKPQGAVKAIDYQGNLYQQNGTIQQSNSIKFNEQRRASQNKGVQMQKTY